MSKSNSSLRSFGIETHEPATSAVARSATLCKPPADRDIGPWERSDSEYGLETQRLTGRHYTSGSGLPADPHHVRWIVDGDVASYVDQYGQDEVWTVPDTYDEFNSVATIVGRVDSMAPDDAYGWGIDGTSLERAFRVLTGGGRYTATHYKVIPCGDHPWLLTGPEGTVLCSLCPVDLPCGETQRATSPIEIAGKSMDIEEENQQVIAGISKFGSLLAERSIYVVDHQCPAASDHYNSKHEFTDTEGDEHRIDPETLVMLSNLQTDPGAVTRKECNVTEPNGASVTLSEGWDGPNHQVGDVVEDKILAGFRFEWDTPEYSPETIATVATYWLADSRGYTLHRRLDRLKTTA